MADQLQVGQIAVAKIAAHPSNIGRDLGDLRDLAQSIKEKGILVPVIVERHGDRYRLRDGHRRIAAANIAGRSLTTAVIHTEPLDEAEWLIESIDYNERRKGYSDEDKRRVAERLIELGVGKGAIAEAFGVPWSKIQLLLHPETARQPKPAISTTAVARRRAIERLTEAHPDEYRRLLLEEGYPALTMAEDVSELLGHGEEPEAIAGRLGKSMGSIEISLRRSGFFELAKPFANASKRVKS